MSQVVKCSVCGKMFNRRYVNSHKRLAHDARPKPNHPRLSELEMVQEILLLYGRLSKEKRKEVQVRLEDSAAAN